MLVAFLSDKFRHRFAFAFIPMLIAMAGYGILLNIHGEAQRHVQYAALFLVTMGCYSAMPVLVCWFSMNLGGHRRRSVGTAWQIGFGNSKSSFSSPIRDQLTNHNFSRRNHFDLLVPLERRAALPQRIHHQLVLPVFLSGNGRPLLRRGLVR